MDLDRRSSFSEIIWRLGRLGDRERITPRQHPFFYQGLPISKGEYDKDFKLHPIEDFQAVFNHDVHVLVDKPGRLFIRSESTRRKAFGNVWMPKDTLIFKGTFPPLSSSLSLTSRQTSSARLWEKESLGWISKAPRTYASAILLTLREPARFLPPWLALPWRLAVAN